MRNLRKRVLVGLCVIGMGLGVSAPARAASGVGPYYAMPSWDQTLPADTRFIVLTNMGGVAVLDRETGLVWEQEPDNSLVTWAFAQRVCHTKSVGNRKGWRLPGIEELSSLIDPLQAVLGRALPPGHPFSSVLPLIYWSATTLAGSSLDAWFVNFGNGAVVGDDKSQFALVWCVRGGQGSDAQ